jgi:hypothetical protein
VERVSQERKRRCDVASSFALFGFCFVGKRNFFFFSFFLFRFFCFVLMVVEQGLLERQCCGAGEAVCTGQLSSDSKVLQTGGKGVQEDSDCNFDWICDYGSDWISGEAGVYSDQSAFVGMKEKTF